MKTILFAGFFLASSLAFAGEHRGITAANLMRALIALGVPQTTEGDVITLQVESVDCDRDTGYMGESRNPVWGMGHSTCTLNGKTQDEAQSELLMRAMAESCFQTDAASGHWMISVDRLVCRIRTNELVNEKRFVCEFEGDQPDPLLCSPSF